MKLYINEKLFSIHRRFYVKDEYDRDVFEISSEFLTIGDKTTVKDMMGNTVAYIEQRILHLMPHYDIYIDGQLVCNIAKKIRLLANDYELSNGYTISGGVMALDFTIYDEYRKQLGSITRKLFSIGDKYTIEIYDEEKLPIVLAIIVSIANDVNRRQRSNY